MNSTVGTKSVWLLIAAVIGVLFGLLTIREGGAVLFGDDAARAAVGDYVPFVVWFNYLAGYAYVIAGAGLAFRQRWAVHVAFGIGVSTLVVFIAFGVYVIGGGAFEMRTVIAMTLRATVWFSIAVTGWRILHEKAQQSPVSTPSKKPSPRYSPNFRQ